MYVVISKLFSTIIEIKVYKISSYFRHSFLQKKKNDSQYFLGNIKGV